MPKILVADDSIAVRKVAERLLTEAGMGVSLAANGEEAMAFLAKECPDLIVSDVIMPDKSGYDVCSFVRAQPNLSEIPVLLISGIVNDDVTKQAESCRADGVLKKPFQGTSLKDRVLELLTKRKGTLTPEPTVSVNGSMATTTRETRGEQTLSGASHKEPRPVDDARERELEGALTIERENLRQLRERVAELEQAAAQVPSLERALAEAQRRVTELSETAKGVDSLKARVQELEAMVTQEKERAQKQVSDLESALESERAHTAQLSHRVSEIESTLAEERHNAEAIKEQLAASAKATARVNELEATLAAERDAAAQLVQQVTELEQTAGRLPTLERDLKAQGERADRLAAQVKELEPRAARVPDLEQQVQAERQQASRLGEKLAEQELAAARIPELESTLANERRKASQLADQLKELEHTVLRARELDSALNEERQRASQLATRATDAERTAEQANRRLEDMARKLAEIAGLASKLGSGTAR